MSQLQDIIDEALLFLPGADSGGAGAVLLNVAQEFFVDSQSWRQLLGPYTVRTGRATLDLEPVAVGVVVGVVLQVRYNGRVLYPAINPPLEEDEGPDPSHFYQVSPSELVMVPTPTQDLVPVHVLATLVPTTLTAEIPQFVWTHFRQTLIDGLVGAMQSMSSKPFTDQAGAVLRLRRFRRGLQRAHDFAARGYGSSDRVWAFPRWSGYRGGA